MPQNYNAMVMKIKNSLTKTQRDIYEAKRLTAKIEEARVERILTEHDSLK